MGYGGTCQHCGVRPVNRPRGLCWTCYYAPGRRQQYPAHGKFAAWADQSLRHDFNGPASVPEAATAAAPGSAEKLAVLEARAMARQELWHPADECGERVPNGYTGERVYTLRLRKQEGKKLPGEEDDRS